MIDDRLEADMGHVRTLSTLGRAAREEVGIRVRQPLGRLLAVVPGAPPGDDVLALLIDEINVKRVEFAASSEGLVTLAARPDFRALGRRFGKLTQEAAARIRALAGDALKVVRDGGTVRIEVDGAWHEVGGEEMEVAEAAKGDWVVRSEGRCTVGLDPAISEALRQEGLARELVNRIQRLRRDSGLAVSDRIRLGIAGGGAVQAAARKHERAIARETLAVRVDVGGRLGEAFDYRKEAGLDGEPAVLGLSVYASP